MLLFVGGKVRRGRQRRADYIFRYRPDHPFAVVEVKAHYKQASDTQAGTGLSGPGRARYRYRDAVEEGGVEALLERTRRVPNPKNRVDLETEEAVVAYAVEYPAHGQVRVSNELRKRGVFVSPSGVRSIWLRHDLAHCKARLKALEAKVAEEGIILTEAQIQAQEKRNWTTGPGAKSTPRIPAILAHRIHFMSAP